MQSELAANHPDLAIQILGVNAAGYEVPNPIFTSGRDIPWLQDVDDDQDGRSDAWVSWGTYDGDVVVLDATNTMVGFFNLSSYSLEDPAHYKTLRQTLVDTAVVPEPSTLALFAMAVVGLFVYARNKRKIGSRPL